LSMVYRYQTLLLAIDHVQSAVSQELSSRYCPFDKTIFLTRFWALFALLVVGALSLSIAARRKWKRKWNAEAEAGPLTAPSDYEGARALAAGDTYARFFHAMLRRGVALAPGAYEVMFPGLAHDEDVLARVVEAAGEAAAEIS